jgi:hypothetical protein
MPYFIIASFRLKAPVHDQHRQEAELRPHSQRVAKLILAKEDVLTISRR